MSSASDFGSDHGNDTAGERMSPNNREELKAALIAYAGQHKAEGNPSDMEVMEMVLTSIEAVGCAVVPAVATVDMEIAGTEQWLCESAMEDRSTANYTAMLSASPFRKG